MKFFFTTGVDKENVINVSSIKFTVVLYLRVYEHSTIKKEDERDDKPSGKID